MEPKTQIIPKLVKINKVPKDQSETIPKIIIKMNDFVTVSEYDKKTIKELTLQAQKYYTHFITNFRALRNIREMAMVMMGHDDSNPHSEKIYEMTCENIKICATKAISNVSQSRLLICLQNVLTDPEERESFKKIMSTRFKTTRYRYEYEFPPSLKTIDGEESSKLNYIPKSNEVEAVFAGYLKTAQNSYDGAIHYRRLMREIRLIIKGYVEKNSQTVKVDLSNGDYIVARKGLKTILSLTSDNIHDIVTEFCEQYMYQVNQLETVLQNELVNDKATNYRMRINTSRDVTDDEPSEY